MVGVQKKAFRASFADSVVALGSAWPCFAESVMRSKAIAGWLYLLPPSRANATLPSTGRAQLRGKSASMLTLCVVSQVKLISVGDAFLTKVQLGLYVLRFA